MTTVGEKMPRSGARAKKSRGKARKSTTPRDPTPPAPANAFEALAASEEDEPSDGEEEEPEPEQERQDAAGADGAVQPTNASTSSLPDSGATEGGSSLAEDILAAPSTLPAQDPVRVETAAYLRRCMLDGTTPPAWVMELVLPGSSRPAAGPSKEQVQEVRGDSLPQNLDVVFERVQGPPTPTTPVQQSSSSDSNCTSPPDQSYPATQTARTTSAAEARTTSAVAATHAEARTTSAVAANHAAPTSPHYGNFSIKKSDLPPSLKLQGLPTEDVPEIMALFRSRIRLHAPEGTPDSVIDHHAVRHLAHLVSGEAASTMNQIQCETLEWRTDKELAQLSADNGAIEIRAPCNWREWVDAFTNLFSPVNRIFLLARTVSNLQQGNNESVDSYGLRVTQAYARLLAEAKRTAPPNVSPYKHAWQTSLMATFEAGLVPHIRLELIREDPSLTYQASRTRAKKHETNALRAAPTKKP